MLTILLLPPKSPVPAFCHGEEVIVILADVGMPGIRRLLCVRVYYRDGIPTLIPHIDIEVEWLGGNGTAFMTSTSGNWLSARNKGDEL